MTLPTSRRPRTVCLLVLNDWMMMEDVAEGLAEVAPHTDALRADSCGAAIELLQTLPAPDFAIIDAPGSLETEQILSALLVERGTTVALVARDEAAMTRTAHPVLDRPFGYSELQSFLFEMLALRTPVTPTPKDCAMFRPCLPGGA